MFPVAMARSFSDSGTICYVLTVLWMTSFFSPNRANGQTLRWCVCNVAFGRWQSDIRQRYTYVWSSSLGGSTGGKVCHLWLHPIKHMYSRV